MPTPKILFAAPLTAASMQQPARALDEIGMLGAYYTTFGLAGDGALMRTARSVDRIVGSRFAAQLERRAISGIAGDFIHTFPWWEIPRTVLARTNISSRLSDAFLRQSLDGFDRHVAAHVGRYSAVYGYNGSTQTSFEAATRQGKYRIYGVRGLHPLIQSVEYAEYTSNAALASSAGVAAEPASQVQIQRRNTEWRLADLIIVNSKLTGESHRECGLDMHNVRVIPLAFPEVFDGTRPRAPDGAPLNVLWTGTFSLRKGAHYFLQALRLVSSSLNIRVKVFGKQELPNSMLSDTTPLVTFHATVPRRQLFEEYRLADVLVLPTLADGFAMVIAEAMSQGLPVITTSRAGAADFIRPGENGILIPARDADALARALSWCSENRDDVTDMGREARKTAKSWQWRDYRREVARVVSEAMGSRGL
jgi:glycosyltransferase involved in cell wall biosynthesis